MTTPQATPPSEPTIMVFGALADPLVSRKHRFLASVTAPAASHDLWQTISEQVDDKYKTSAPPKPSFCQVLLPFPHEPTADETFRDLTHQAPHQEYFVLFGMPPSWSSYVQVLEENKENLMAGMADMSLADDEDSRKSTGGSNVPSKSGRRASRRPPAAALTIESLRQELLGEINVQANSIRALESSNVDLISKVNGLTLSNAKLTSSNTELTSSNTELITKVNGLTTLNTGLISKVKELTSSNTELISKVKGLTSSNAELTSSNAELTSSNAKLTSSNTKLISKVNGLTSKVDGLTSANAELTSLNAKLTSSNAELISKLNGLTSSNEGLLKKVNELETSNSDMSNTLKSHARTLHSLNRRMVLDDARNKLAMDYRFTFDELRPRRSDVGSLVQNIQSRLNAEDAKLLSYDALFMIFDSSEESIRDDGNKAAHEASLADRVDSVLEATLKKTQRALLGEIYYFAHGKEPDF